MSTTATINLSPEQLRSLVPPRTSHASDLYQMAAQFSAIARDVRENWKDLPGPVRELLTKVAYHSIELEEIHGWRLWLTFKGWKHLFIVVTSVIAISWRFFKGEREALKFYILAFEEMTQAILEAIEQENPAFQAKLLNALLDRSERKEVPDDIRGWLDKL